MSNSMIRTVFNLWAVLFIVAGVAMIVMGCQARKEVRAALAEENIITASDAAIPSTPVTNDATLKAQADIIREHTLETTGGLHFAEMGRFATADGSPAGTSDATKALKDADGKPVPNTLRSTWFNATNLITALNLARTALGVSLLIIALGAAFIAIGIAFGLTGLAFAPGRNGRA